MKTTTHTSGDEKVKKINMAARRAARVGRARAANKAAAQAQAKRWQRFYATGKWEAGEETTQNFYGSDFEAGRGVGSITWAE